MPCLFYLTITCKLHDIVEFCWLISYSFLLIFSIGEKRRALFLTTYCVCVRCEAFSTYPRTYDLIHANGVFSLYKDKYVFFISVLLESLPFQEIGFPTERLM